MSWTTIKPVGDGFDGSKITLQNGNPPPTPPPGFTCIFVDGFLKETSQIDDQGVITSFIDGDPPIGETGGFTESGIEIHGDFLVSIETNNSIRIAGGRIVFVDTGAVDELVLSNDLIITQLAGLPSSGAYKVLAIEYMAGDELYVNNADIALFVAPANECTIAVLSLSVNILGRGDFDIGAGTIQTYRRGIELAKIYYVDSTLFVIGRGWSIYDNASADFYSVYGNATSNNRCVAYDDAGVIKYRTNKTAVNMRRSVAPVGKESVEQQPTTDIFLGMALDKSGLTFGLPIRGHVQGLVDAQNKQDFAPNSDFLPGGQYEEYWNFYDITSDDNPSQLATWSPKVIAMWSLMVLAYYPSSGNVIMIMGNQLYLANQIDLVSQQQYHIHINNRAKDVVAAGAFFVRSSNNLDLSDVLQVPASKVLITQ